MKKTRKNTPVTVTYDACPAYVIRCNGCPSTIVIRYHDMVWIMNRDEAGNLVERSLDTLWDHHEASLVGEAMAKLAALKVEK